MENLEKICFEIITHSGQAKANVMEAVDLSKQDDSSEENIKKLVAEARENLKTAQNEHFKVLSKYAKDKKNIVNPLYMHAEDQMMSAETFLDFAVELIDTNKELNDLKKKMKPE